MVKNLRYYLTPLILSTILSLSAQDNGCDGFRTQTQGGWGASANGNNPGVYRDIHFDQAFPDGLSIGCHYVLELETSADVQVFLPSGGTARPLEGNLLNPTDYGNVLAGQLVALTLSVGFDNAYPDFSSSSYNLAELVVNNGTFEGYTVAEILEIGNSVLGGCETDFSPSQVNDILSSINENYVDGTTNGGLLDCPEEEPECALALSGMSTECTENDTYILQATVTGANGSYRVISESALSIDSEFICFGQVGESPAENVVTILLEFPQNADYEFSIVPAENEACDQSANIDCRLDNIAGVAPSCCTLVFDCEGFETLTYSCLSEVPDAYPEVTYTTEGCGEVSLQVSETTQGNGCQNNPLVLTRTYTVTNGTDMVSCTQTFMVIDDIAPVISCPPDQYTSCAASIPPDEYATATDNCDSEVFISYYNGPLQGCGFFVRTWIATDDCGNSDFCYQNVYVEDTEAPQITVPENVTVDCGESIHPSNTGFPQVTDACSDVQFFYEDSEPGVDECTSTITRMWTATDACGNTATAEQLITVADISGPIILGVPANQVFQCTEVPPAPDVYAVDNCSGDTVDVEMEETISDDGCRKTILRTFTAVDNCGNATSLSRTITIEDTQGPELVCPSDVLLTCGDENIGPSETGEAEAFDACSEEFVTISFEDSEYQANACPPRIMRTWTAVDTCGNATNCVQMIMFDDQEAPVIDCVDDITINCSEATIDPEFTGTPTTEDACGEAVLTYVDGPFDGNCPGNFVRTWEAADACGNTSYCYQVITVIDEEPPTLVCPPTATLMCGQSYEPYNAGMATATDQCLDVFLSYEDGEITGDCEKQFTRTWTATDACGNSTSCDQVINILDQMNPVITCPPTASIECGGDSDPAVTGVATAVDFCSDVEVSYQDQEDLSSCTPSIQRTWTATDICGNTASCIQVIEITGGGILDITCPDNITIACGEEADPALTGEASASATCADVLITYTDSIAPIESTSGGDCGQLRTQTQGGWGSSASGNNPGAYRDANFETAFPEGVVLGCEYTLTFTSSAAVEEFLPSGGPVKILDENLVDPDNYHSVFAGQLLAATLSVGFDVGDESFSESDADLGEYTISSGPMGGLTVNEVLAEANAFIGGCGSNYSGSVLNTTLTSINESFVDGNGEGGFLNCPESGDEGNCVEIYRTWIATDACGNSVECTQVITQADVNQGLVQDAGLMAYPSPATSSVNLVLDQNFHLNGTLTIANQSGVVVHTEMIPAGMEFIQLDLSDYEDGIYLVNFTSPRQTVSTKFVKM
jgi:hypothetical protein